MESLWHKFFRSESKKTKKRLTIFPGGFKVFIAEDGSKMSEFDDDEFDYDQFDGDEETGFQSLEDLQEEEDEDDFSDDEDDFEESFPYRNTILDDYEEEDEDFDEDMYDSVGDDEEF